MQIILFNYISLPFRKNYVSSLSMADLKENTQNLSFEAALKELEEIVRKLESGQTNLDSAIKDYERGNELRVLCEAKLNEAKLKVEKIIKNEGGKVTTEEFSQEIN